MRTVLQTVEEVLIRDSSGIAPREEVLTNLAVHGEVHECPGGHYMSASSGEGHIMRHWRV